MNKNITLEDLDYIIKKQDDECIIYKKEDEFRVKVINFVLVFESVICNSGVKIDNMMIPESIMLSMSELQAVINKCKELGWLDEKNSNR